MNYEGRCDDGRRQRQCRNRPDSAAFRNGSLQYQYGSNKWLRCFLPADTEPTFRGWIPQNIGDKRQHAVNCFRHIPPAQRSRRRATESTQKAIRFPYTLAPQLQHLHLPVADWNAWETWQAQRFLARQPPERQRAHCLLRFPASRHPRVHADQQTKGFAVGYTPVLTSSIVNNLRYGLTRQGFENAGISNQAHVYLAAVAEPQAFTRSSSTIVPVQNLVDDVSWTRHTHNIQFGDNLRLIDDRQHHQRQFLSPTDR
jgi:hypothetical protein